MDPFANLSALTNLYLDLQKTRISAENRARTIDDPDLDELIGEVKSLEETAAKDLKKIVRTHPFWAYWLKGVTGIGELMSAQLIHYVKGKVHTLECQKKRAKYFAKKSQAEKKALTSSDNPRGKRKPFHCDCPVKTIERFANVSKLWHYAGLHVVNGKAAHKQRGKQIDWNPKLKSLCWNIGKSFVIHKGSEYRKYYDEFKNQEQTKHPELRKGHIDARARRKTVKLFLAHVFDQWYRLKGLEAPKPYAIGILEHSNEIKPSDI